MAASGQRVLIAGATGTIGRATVDALMARGHRVTAIGRATVRPDWLPATVQWLPADLTGATADLAIALGDHPFDTVISCIASRTGVPADAWAVDHGANRALLHAAQAVGTGRFVLLSAICVQKPLLAFQHAKLAFEAELQASGLAWSIVRPTAFFKSLSGQIDRVRTGKPFLLFGDGRLTACKPISDRDLAAYLADCLTDPARANRILPIGGPGPAITPREQGEALFAMTGRPPRFRSLPIGLLDGIIAGLSVAGRVFPSLADKAELARIGRYYATESMLVLDPVTGRYDTPATPEAGTDTLFEHYRAVLDGAVTVERGDHAVF